MLSATPIERSNVIELRAEGPNGALLPQVLSAWVEAYRRSRSESFDHTSAAALEEALSTVAKLKEDVAAQRLALDEFRRKHDIVSIERDENQATARLRSLTAALNEARNRQVDAEARLTSMRANLAAGKAAPEAIDGSIVADLERRASDLRERMKDLEQEFTPQFLRFEPKYQALRTNLARLEQQIEQEKRAGTGRALQKVGQEAESARQAVARLQEELKGLKREVQDFTVRFSESTQLANELARLEKAHESARERVAQLEAEKKARPALTVLSLPTVPERPERPDYARDAAIAVTGAALLGILAVWFVEFFRRSGVPRPAPVTQPIINISLAPGMALDQGMRVIGATASRELTVNTARLPGMAAVFPRELSDAEVRALWQAAAPGARIAIAGLMGGLSTEELAALRYRHVDLHANIARVPGSLDARMHPARAAAAAPDRRAATQRRRGAACRRTGHAALRGGHRGSHRVCRARCGAREPGRGDHGVAAAHLPGVPHPAGHAPRRNRGVRRARRSGGVPRLRAPVAARPGARPGGHRSGLPRAA